jgi:phosphatidylserine/phosphatidylglycerophosphate/cardiolipin synthase-like enzyme
VKPLEEHLRIVVSIVILVAALSFRPTALATNARLRGTASEDNRRSHGSIGGCSEWFRAFLTVGKPGALDIAELRKAKQRVDIAMYSFTDRRLTEVINELAARRVEMRVYRDQEQFEDEERMAVRHGERSTTQSFRGRPTIHVRVKQGSLRDLMHEKAFCIDGHLFREGSANWSRGGLLVQDNNAHYSSDATAIERFERAFEKMWERRDNLVFQ